MPEFNPGEDPLRLLERAAAMAEFARDQLAPFVGQAAIEEGVPTEEFTNDGQAIPAEAGPYGMTTDPGQIRAATSRLAQVAISLEEMTRPPKSPIIAKIEAGETTPDVESYLEQKVAEFFRGYRGTNLNIGQIKEFITGRNKEKLPDSVFGLLRSKVWAYPGVSHKPRGWLSFQPPRPTAPPARPPVLRETHVTDELTPSNMLQRTPF